jgi:hypothetical protein
MYVGLADCTDDMIAVTWMALETVVGEIQASHMLAHPFI